MIEAEHSLFRAWSNHLTDDCRMLFRNLFLFSTIGLRFLTPHGSIVHRIGSAHIEIAVSEILLLLAIAFSFFTAH